MAKNNRIYTINGIAEKIDKYFTNDESLPQDKRSVAGILAEELRGIAVTTEESLSNVAQFLDAENERQQKI